MRLLLPEGAQPLHELLLRAAVVDDDIGQPALLYKRHLRGDAALGLLAAVAIAALQARELQRLWHVDQP